jgi:lipoprotein signal peptidase
VLAARASRPFTGRGALLALFTLFATLATADRVTKLWALANLTEGTSDAPLLSIGLRLNRGISFSLLAGHPLASAAPLAAIAILAFACLRFKAIRRTPGVVFLWAGALCNMADRLMYGYVVDWLRILVYVNLADVWLVAGGFLTLCWVCWRE